MSSAGRKVIVPEETDAPESVSGLADVEVDDLSFRDIVNSDFDVPEGRLEEEDVEDFKDENGFRDSVFAGEEVDLSYNRGLENSVVIADDLQGDLSGSVDSLVVAGNPGEENSTHQVTRMENSVIVGDMHRVMNAYGGESADYGTVLRESRDSTWVGDVTVSDIFRRSHENMIFGNIGEEDTPVRTIFENSANNVVIGDEVHAESIGSEHVNFVAADEVEAEGITSNTVVFEGDDFQGELENLANFFFNVSNRVLEPFRAFNLDRTYEDWKEVDEEMAYANDVWPEVSDSYFFFRAVEDTFSLPGLEGENQEIYDRLKGFETNFNEVNLKRVDDQEVLGVLDSFNGENTVYIGESYGKNVFSISYDEDVDGFEQLLSAIDDDIEDELNFFDFDGGDEPSDLVDEIEKARENSEKIQEEYDDILALFDRLELDRFEANGDLGERLEGFDQEIKNAAKQEWSLDDNSAEGLVESENTSYVIDILPESLQDQGKEDYLKIVTGTLESNESIDLDPEDVESVQRDLHGLFEAPIDASYKTQMVNKIIEDVPEEANAQRRQISEFAETLGHLKSDVREELYESLKSEKDSQVAEGETNEHGEEVLYSDGESKFGNTLVEIGKSREYNFFVEDEPANIEELLEAEGKLPKPDEFFEDDSPYREVIEELISEESLENGEESSYGKMSDQELAEKLRKVSGLAERIGFEYDASNVFSMLKGKEGRRQNTGFEPDEEDLESLLENRRRELEKDVQNKLRAYTKEGIKQIGFSEAAEKYREATGEIPDDLSDNEIAALKVKERFHRRGINQTVDKLLQHQNDVYKLEANQEWLEQHEFDEEELIDPDLSNQAEGEYRRPEDPDYKSELQVEVDPSDVQMDTEREEQQYLAEIGSILEKEGVETKEEPDEWEDIQEGLDELFEEKGVETDTEDIQEVKKTLRNLSEESSDSDNYGEMGDVIGFYHGVENRSGGIPDYLTMRVADPMDTTRMGQGFGSCHDIDGGSYAWASVSNAVDANKMVFYAEDEKGRERARVKAFITEDEELVYHNTSQYKDIDVDTSEYFEGYMEKVAENLGLDVKHSSEVGNLNREVELLEAHDWYSGS